MATKREIELQKESNRLQKESNQLLSEQLKLNKESVKESDGISNTLQDQLRFIKFQNAEKSSILSIDRRITKAVNDSYSTELEGIGTKKFSNDLAKKQSTLQQDINILKLKSNAFDSEGGELQQSINESIIAQIQNATELNNSLEKQAKLSEKISNSFSVKKFQGLSDLVKDIPIIGKLSEPFEKAAAAARGVELKNNTLDQFKELRKEGATISEALSQTGLKIKDISKGPTNSLNAGFKTLGSTLQKSFGVGVIIAIASQFLKANKEIVELQKSMALTSSEASTLRQEFSNIANDSGNINITTSALLTTVSELSKQFGFIAMFSADTLVTTTKLTQQVGISAEAAGRLAAASVSTGENFEEQYKNALGTSYELQRQEGVQFDLRQILEESGKVTGTIRANLGTNVESIAKAVTQAKLFGASLNDVAGASKALLDFESSITAELEAELLLGKSINLETARQASLNGDMVTLAKELRKEAGDYTEFSKMNVIQQEALAKAMGMQSDQLADILFQQDIQGKTARELRAVGKDDLATKLEAQTAQDKFNKSIEKLQSLLGDAVTAFIPILDVLSDVFTVIAKIAKIFNPIIGAISGAVAGSAFGLPGAAVGLLIGAASDINRGMSTADDAIIPTTGYGDTIIKSGKDTLALNNQDSVAVVAGTNLGGGSDKVGERTNQLLESLIMQNAKKPELSPVGLYEIQ